MTRAQCKQKLRSLRPAVLKPSNAPTSSIVLQELKDVCSIHVSPSGGKSCYAVEVLASSPRVESVTATSSRLSTTDSTDSEGSAAVQVNRGLQDFVYLHERVFNIVRRAHPSRQCRFCLKIADLLVFGSSPDGLLLRFLGSERVARRLAKFITDLTVLTAQCSPLGGRESCSGQALVVQVVYELLLTPSLI
ncbi:hypothetical protein PHYSODRAFT_480553 [Phytophthora sojae]|uniref:Uncharacterized protein n=1 Tax=Phytophthora sojae (strain P6497) TaxID=1094619 RepID=G4YW44_PHYSP|nr:hypothetical protein PHYSODRAFT_480553 [Phytophthora sojae]EGZ24426.1 hypothetical protein PHYSODRAFT_480553 [Phytophthora sojae]|eukprot:XP_009519714.1 hypothetical protein PHYSODRAFT_480553 [Phytophthora sojae]